MSATCPRVRDACETCHKRKIRCLLEPGSTSCQSCSINGKSCLFAPRAKAGRPKKIASQNQQRRKVTWTQAREKISTTQNGGEDHRSSSESLVMTAADELHYGSVMAFDSYWGSEKISDMEELRDLDFLAQEAESRQEEHDPQNITNNEILPPDPTKQDSVMGILTPSRSSTPPRPEPFAAVNESLDFDAALKLCGDLDRSYRALRDGRISAQEVDGIISMMEYACVTARATAFSASAEKASITLILAAIYKVFDICETLVRQINEGSNQDLLEVIFRMKRMDLALLQAYMFLNQIGQTDAMKKISELHTWMDSILQHQRYRVIW